MFVFILGAFLKEPVQAIGKYLWQYQIPTSICECRRGPWLSLLPCLILLIVWFCRSPNRWTGRMWKWGCCCTVKPLLPGNCPSASALWPWGTTGKKLGLSSRRCRRRRCWPGKVIFLLWIEILNLTSGWKNQTTAVDFKSSFLLSIEELLIPILVPFSAYSKLMVESDTMKVEAVVTDKKNPDHMCLAEDDIVLKNPPISVEVSVETSVCRKSHLSSLCRCLSNKQSQSHTHRLTFSYTNTKSCVTTHVKEKSATYNHPKTICNQRSN